MTASSRDRISVDLRGLKAALMSHASDRGVSPSSAIREALAATLGAAASRNDATAAGQSIARVPSLTTDPVRVSLRLCARDAQALRIAAKAAQLPLGAYLAGLAEGIPAVGQGMGRQDALAELVASSAELATLSRNVRHLTSLLKQGSVRAAQEYRAVLDTLTADVHEHLTLASATLADLRPGGPNQRPGGAHMDSHIRRQK
jgi:hypothetical protein